MSLVHDARHAAKALRRLPVFTMAALFSFTLGIASSALVFSVL